MWNELTNPVCVFYKRILADERMQMRHINMLALLPSHFIFFPLIKKDISYVTSPLCSYQDTHTHTRESEGCCTGRNTHAHTCRRRHTLTQPLWLQTTIQYAHVLWKTQWVWCNSKFRQLPTDITWALLPRWPNYQRKKTISSKQYHCSLLCSSSSLRFLFLTSCMTKRLGTTSCLTVSAMSIPYMWPT